MTRRRKRASRKVPRNPKLCVKYVRVSSKEQEREGFSIPAQIKTLDHYEARQGMISQATFEDIETAKQSGRAAFGEMVEFLKKHKRVGSILVEKTDRLYRNPKDAVIIDDIKVEIHMVKEGAVVSETSKSSEKFMHGIRVLTAKQYTDNLSEEVRKGMNEKAAQGYWPTKAPFGYLNMEGPNGKRIISPDPNTADIVVTIFKWYLSEEITLDQLVEKLRTNGLTVNGKRFTKSSVIYILRNRLYSGDFIWNANFYKGLHEPLVSREQWSRVQEKMDGRANCKPQGEIPFAFSGLIKCALCGSSVVAERKKERYTYYHLSAYRDQCHLDPKTCKQDWVREEDIEAFFCNLLAGLQFEDGVLQWLREALLASSSEERAERQRAIKRLESEDRRLADRLEKLYVDKLEGNVEPEFYAELAQKWRGEREHCRRQIDALAHEEETFLEEGGQVVEFLHDAHRLFDKQPPDEKRRLLNFVLSNCTWERGQLCASLRQPFDFLLNTVDEAENVESSRCKKTSK